MIAFDNADGRRFNFRVAGIAIDRGRVFIHRAVHQDFWTFPGGRAEMGEPAAQTLRREMREELSVEVDVIRPLWIVENFFDFDGRRCHELGFYFLMQFPAGCRYLAGPGPYEAIEPGTELICEWATNTTAELTARRLYPTFLREALQQLPDRVEHRVHVDS
jgi:8-oxo-dGTP pyrophosphatase MutT (NUDIX family)